MNLEPAALYGGIGLVCGAIGWTVRGTRLWTRKEKDLEIVQDSHARLKSEFIRHKDDRDIHIDPRRDAASLESLKTMMGENFKALHDRLSRIDERCEKRGESCASHFSRVEQRIAAVTGKTNGSD